MSRQIPVLTMALIAGCSSQDARLAEYAQQASQRQAEQNQAIAEQSRAVIRNSHEVTAAAQELVQQDALARREMIEAQDRLQQQNHVERTVLDQQRKSLAEERKVSAQAAVRDPVIAEALLTVGLALAALLPLLVTALALRALPRDRPDLEIVETALLAQIKGLPPGLADPQAPALPGDEAHRLSDHFSDSE